MREKTFTCNRCILALRCPKLLESGQKASSKAVERENIYLLINDEDRERKQEGQLVIKLQTAKSFEVLLSYLHTGMFPNLKETLIEIHLFKKDNPYKREQSL